MSSWLVIALLWLGFAGSHLLLSHGAIRQNLIKRLGAGPFMGLYSLISFVFFLPLVWVYLNHRHEGALLWNLVALPGVKHLAMLLGLLGIAGVVAAYAQPAATGIIPVKNKAPYGLTRITRHPLFMALGLWGLSHCLLNGYASDVAFFAGFPLFAVIGCAHQDARKRSREEFKDYFANTSFWPFAGLFRGQGIVIGELPWLWLALGTALSVVLYKLHGLMFY